MVAEGKFRADLYFRLSVVPLHLPALRERGDDFDIIVDLTLARMCERTGRDLMTLEPSARVAIRAYSWPGNVRELAHRIERAALLARGTQIAEGDLSLPTSQTPIRVVRSVITAEGSGPIPKQNVLDDSTLDLRSALEAVERTLIDRALSKANGNRTEAAALLGLNRTTLVEKLRKYAA
jgi:DNA-binding NtrC family response regulator